MSEPAASSKVSSDDPEDPPLRRSRVDGKRGQGRALGSAAVYTVGYAVQRAIGLLLLPFYTRAISPAEYGEAGLLLSIAAAAAILFSAGLDIAVFRRYFQLANEPARQRRFLYSTWRFLIVVPVGAAFILSVAAWPFAARWANANGLDMMLALEGAAFGVAATVVPLSVLRAEQSLRKYMVLTAVTGLGTPIISAAFVLGLGLGVRGWLGAILLTNIIGLLAALWVLPWPRQTRFDGNEIRASLRFSLPLLPQSFSAWALQLADRSVIAGLVTTSALGLYSLASNVATPAMILVLSLQQGLMPTYASAGMDPERRDTLRDTVVLQVVLVVAITLGASLFLPLALDFIVPPSYAGAVPLVPWIVLGYGFLGLYYIPMNGATLSAGRGKHSWIATSFSAVANIGLLLVLVPGHGIHAAAIASALGYLALLIGNSIYAHAGANPLRYDWVRIIPALLLGSAAYAVATLTAPASEVGRLGVDLTCFIAFALAVLKLDLLRDLSPFKRAT